MKRFLLSDQDFRDIYQNFYGMILSYLFRYLGNLQDAADITQEVLWAAYVEFSKPDCQVENWTAWLKAVAKNKAVDFLRGKKFKSISLESGKVPLENQSSANFDESLHNLLDNRVKLCSLKHTLLVLPENEFWAICLRDFQSLPFKRVGERLKSWRIIEANKPLEAARSLYRRGVQRLRNLTTNWLRSNSYHKIVACQNRCRLASEEDLKAHQRRTRRVVIRSIK